MNSDKEQKTKNVEGGLTWKRKGWRNYNQMGKGRQTMCIRAQEAQPDAFLLLNPGHNNCW